MTGIDLYSAVLTILSAIITGGFVLVYIEIGNRKNRRTDNYEKIMRPFFKKLTAYFKFVSWCSISYPSEMTEIEKEFKNVADELSRLGGQAIMSGGDYELDYFSAKELYEISYNKINHLWYLRENMRPVRLKLYDSLCCIEEEIRKELIKIRPEYATKAIDFNLLIRVSSEFHIEEYQPIETETYYYESFMNLYKKHTLFVTSAVICVLLLICLILCVQIPDIYLKLSTISIVCMLALSILMLGINEKKQLTWLHNIHKMLFAFKVTLKQRLKILHS